MSVSASGDLVEIVSLPGKTIFERNSFTVRRTPDEAVAPRILALECRQGFEFDRWAQEIPEALWARAAAGRMRILFDASTEGRLHTPEATEQVHAFLREKGAPLVQAVYLTQDRSYRADYADYTGLAEGQGMQVVFADYWIRRFFLKVEKVGPALFEDRFQRFRHRGHLRGRRLISLNLTPRESKVLFLLRLMRDGAWDQAYVSFGGFGMNHRGKGVSIRTWPDEFASLKPYEERLAAMGRFVFGEDADYTDPDYATPVYDADLRQHDDSWFTVVPETEMRNRPSRITEKPCKPLVNFHPLIFAGNPGALPLLREWGFQTFDGFFDEAYDDEPDPRRRFDLVYDQVLALCRADECELVRRAAAVEEALVHNARWGLMRLPADIRKRRDAALLASVLT